MDVMAYKGYTGSIEFSAEDNVYFGKIIGIRSLISYEGETAKELLEDAPYQFIDTEQEFVKGKG